MRVPRIVLAAGASAVLAASVLAPSASATGCASAVTTLTPPSGTDGAFGVTAGPGGTWFAHGGTIDRVRAGGIDEFALPDAEVADAGWLTFDPATGLVWFADRGTGRLGTIDAVGRVHEWQVPDGSGGQAVPQGIVVGPGPHAWFTDQVNDRIGDLDTSTGGITMHAVPTTDATVLGLARGSDGNLWFTERSADKVGRMTPAGVVTEWSLAAGAFPNRIVAGPDGALWFTELRGGAIGRITTAGALTETPVDGGPVGITVGPDGHLYTALFLAGQVAELDATGGVARTWAVPGALQVAWSHGSIWTTDPFSDTVSRIGTRCPS